MPGRFAALRRRFGIASRRVAIRAEVPWYLRWLVMGVAGGLVLWGGAQVYDFGLSAAGFNRSELKDELVEARREIDALKAEAERLRAIANASESRVSIEQVAQKRLADQVRLLEKEAAQLREDLAIFEGLVSSGARAGDAVLIRRFKVDPDGLPGEYRYRILLVATARQDRDYQGRYDLIVSTSEAGRNAMITFPDGSTGNADGFRFAFKNFRRIEGTFRVGANARAETVQVRVFETGSTQPRVTQSVKPG